MLPRVAIIMGSKSDWSVMCAAQEILTDLGVVSHTEVVSAHRTPEKMVAFAKSAKANGFHIVIAGAGGAAHLPGMVASLTPLPVIGVPVKSSNSLDGWDSILSILQMPAGVPVATVALNNAKNAGLLAAQILALADAQLSERLTTYRETQTQAVLQNSKIE
ncbi:MAG TPA: 5-(carboxyamino)imidazole ribonucleotide mutase [Turneriella sp.]|nr:5-(carboxyamino)imidazole ribonucleotide mutase [Turneriella sp.]